MEKHSVDEADAANNPDKKKKSVITVSATSDENDDWIKLANPLSSLEELLIREVLSRYRDQPEQSKAIYKQMEGLGSLKKYDLITDLLKEWGAELPYWLEQGRARLEKQAGAVQQQPLIAEERAGYVIDEKQKEVYRERLRKKLQDPKFRQIEGFPIGEDEDIMALSDPPYYTACPNPFLPEIIEQWQIERNEIRRELGLPDDSSDGVNSDGYHREPFAADVSEGKSGGIYTAHTYHTKVPHKAIMRYILHYTDPGDLVFDGFCGTGMTGVAAQLCGDRQEIRGLGYRVDNEGKIYDGDRFLSQTGIRRTVLNDLCPAATFISTNYNIPTSADLFRKEADHILCEFDRDWGWMYRTWHPNSKGTERTKARINYTVWSDVFICPECGAEMIFWDIAVDKETGYRKARNSPLKCSNCNMMAPLNMLERAWTTRLDPFLNTVIQSIKRVPVLINYSTSDGRFERAPDAADLDLIKRTDQINITEWFPITRMPVGDESRRNDDIGITHVHHFYTQRNLNTIAFLSARARSAPEKVRARLQYWLQSVGLGNTLLNRYLAASYSQVNRYLKGTLYVAPFISEVAPRYALQGKMGSISNLTFAVPSTTIISTGSAASIPVIDNSIDYIFTDPPFGANINYSDLNFIWESWYEVFTNSLPEAIVSNAHKKGLREYQDTMVACFKEYFRLLKPGRWMTVEFHNSKNSVWNAIQEALTRAGFVVADVRTLDKKQMTMQQMTSTGAVKQDLVISVYKPLAKFEERFFQDSGTVEGARRFVRQHLAKLPVVVAKDGCIETLSERLDYLLFDRMVAFHIQRGASVPMSASEFYASLRERFVERDGMFFLPDQVPEYDKARLKASEVAQLSLFVNDEKSSIQWLRQQLAEDLVGNPQTYQDIQPKFLRQLHQARHEALPELADILEENFLQDDQGRWYAPDPNKASDLEKLRQRALLREFNQYRQAKKKLRQFRTEAVRAGFAHAWHYNEYATIIQMAERLPERVLQEDPELLMYYDNASLYVERE